MGSFGLFLATAAICAAGGVLGYKLKLPMGALLGAMLAAIVFNLTTERGVFYPELRIVIQILAGAFESSRMDKETVKGIKKLFLPIFIQLCSMFVLNIITGYAMYRFSFLDAPTALLATIPGGAADISIIATDFGGNTAYVALLQLSRLIIIFMFLPALLKRTLPRPRTGARDGLAPKEKAPAGQCSKNKYRSLCRLIFWSSLGGGLAAFAGVPAGAIIGSVLGGACCCVVKGKVDFPKPIKICVQIGSGIFIGLRVSREAILLLGELLVPLLIMFLGIIAFCFGVAWLNHKITKLDLATCILASSPGGKQEMVLLAEDLGADTPSVAIMQTTRLVCVIAIFPSMLRLISGLWQV